MKTESTAKYIIVMAAKLLIITAVVALALAGVNSITAPIITQLKADNLQKAIETVLPGGGESTEFDKEANPLVSAVYASETGYAVEVNPAGFGGTITMMVGIDPSGSVIAIDVVSQAETAGLGAIIDVDTEAGKAFRGQFAGVGGTVSVSKDGGQIDSITGATITSRAVCDGVQAALDCVANMG